MIGSPWIGRGPSTGAIEPLAPAAPVATAPIVLSTPDLPPVVLGPALAPLAPEALPSFAARPLTAVDLPGDLPLAAPRDPPQRADAVAPGGAAPARDDGAQDVGGRRRPDPLVVVPPKSEGIPASAPVPVVAVRKPTLRRQRRPEASWTSRDTVAVAAQTRAPPARSPPRPAPATQPAVRAWKLPPALAPIEP